LSSIALSTLGVAIKGATSFSSQENVYFLKKSQPYRETSNKLGNPEGVAPTGVYPASAG
jgi:hypothetical protein